MCEEVMECGEVAEEVGGFEEGERCAVGKRIAETGANARAGRAEKGRVWEWEWEWDGDWGCEWCWGTEWKGGGGVVVVRWVRERRNKECVSGADGGI